MKWFYVVITAAMVFAGLSMGVHGFVNGDDTVSRFGEYLMDVSGVLLIVVLLVYEAFPQLI